MARAVVTLAVVVSLSGGVVIAAPVADPGGLDDRVRSCAAIANDGDRLRCFDTAAKELKIGEPPEATDERGWHFSTKINPMDDTKTVMMTRYSQDLNALLFVSCVSHELGISIDWDTYLGSEKVPVTVRLDSATAERNNWDVSNDRRTAFYPYDGGVLLERLLGTSQLIAFVSPFQASPITSTFDIRGLESHAADLRACGKGNAAAPKE